MMVYDALVRDFNKKNEDELYHSLIYGLQHSSEN